MAENPRERNCSEKIGGTGKYKDKGKYKNKGKKLGRENKTLRKRYRKEWRTTKTPLKKALFTVRFYKAPGDSLS